MKLLLTGAFDYGAEQTKYLEHLGYELTFVQDERQKLGVDVSDFDAVVCNSLFLYNDIKEFKKLKLVQLTAAGLDRAPVEYINQNGIKLFNARGVYSIPIAEFVVCGILELYKQRKEFFDNAKEHKWQKIRGLTELAGKRALIVGCGSIGSEIAKRLAAFDVDVIGVDLYPIENKSFEYIACFEKLDKELQKADIVILSLPLSDSTKHFFDNEKFALLKEGSIFVNPARGALVDEQALIDVLKSKKLFGAVLDVFENEPLDESSPLWDMDNVIVTPHNSFEGENNKKRLFGVIAENLKDFAEEMK